MPTATPAPPDQCRTASTTRSGPIDASTTSSAPWNSARSSDAADTSTAHTSAPRARATATAASPTPPQPMTSTLSPPSTFARCATARYAVATRQPSPAAARTSRSSGSRTRLVAAAWTTTSSANEPGSVKPGWRCCGHTWPLPEAQTAHSPQAMTNGAVTRTPTHAGSTPAPTVSTTPASS